MALMRFRSKPRPRSLWDAAISLDDRRPEHLGDVPPAPPEPERTAWSLSSYPYPDPTRTLADDEQPEE